MERFYSWRHCRRPALACGSSSTVCSLFGGIALEKKSILGVPAVAPAWRRRLRARARLPPSPPPLPPLLLLLPPHHNNNNNTIWGGSVLTGEGPPLHSGELKHALPSWRPNPIPAIPPHVVRTPHLHGAPTTEETVEL